MPRTEGNTLFLETPLTHQTVPELFTAYRKKPLPRDIIRIDLSSVPAMDTAGAAFTEWLAAPPHPGGTARLLDAEGASPEIQRLMEEFTAPREETAPGSSSGTAAAPQKNQKTRHRPSNALGALGGAITDSLQGLGQFLVLLAEVCVFSLAGIFRRGQRRKNSVLEQCWIIGVQSLPLVALLSIILGLILSLQSAIQLRTFGANIFVADLMAVSMVTEMGPMMTAILVAGRSGSSIASEVATMKVSEEIDALRVMGIDPLQYVIVPKFLAMTVTIPLLVIFSIYLGIGGGVLVGMTVLDITPGIFLDRVTAIIDVPTILRSLAKSVLFGWMIVVIGSHFGFTVSGGSEEVGLATTKAVVYSIISVILVDALFSMTYV